MREEEGVNGPSFARVLATLQRKQLPLPVRLAKPVVNTMLLVAVEVEDTLYEVLIEHGGIP